MEYRSSEVKAGLFIFISIIGLVAMIFMMENIQDYFKPRKIIKIVFNFIGGMELGAPVRYAGLDIGSVRNIKLQESKDEKGSDRVKVIAEINPAIIIKKNSIAMIKTAGLMGGLYIDIRPGTKGSPELAANEELIGQDFFEIAEIGDMAAEVILEIRRFTKLTEELVADVRETLEGVRTSVSHIDTVVMENRPVMKANMDNALKISGKLSSFLDKNSGKMEAAFGHAASVAKNADKLLTDKDTQIREIINQMHNMSREMEILIADTRPKVTSLINSMEANAREITADIDHTATSVVQTLDQGNSIMVENRRSLLEFLKNMNETSRNLKSLTEDLKRNPWKLIRKSDEVPVKPAEVSISGKPGTRMKRLDKLTRQ